MGTTDERLRVDAGPARFKRDLLDGAVELAAKGREVSFCAVLTRRPDAETTVLASAGTPSAEMVAAWPRLDELDQVGENRPSVNPRIGVRAVALEGDETIAVVVEGSSQADRLALLTSQVSSILALPGGDSDGRPLLEAFAEIGTQVQAETQHLDRVLRTVVEKGREVVGTDICWLALVDEAGRRLELRVATGAVTAGFQQLWTEIGTGIGGTAVGDGETLFVPDQSGYGHGMPESARRTLIAEGVASILCSPIIDGDEILGALYVASREPTIFGPTSSAVLSTLATHAAVAICNARLYEELADRNRALENAAVVHQTLTSASLAGAGLQELVDEIAAMVHCPICITIDGLAPRRVWSSGHEDRGEPPPTSAVVPITAAAAHLGTLAAACGDGDLDVVDQRALEDGATVIALELVKQRAGQAVEWRLLGELLEELLQTEAGDLSAALTERVLNAGVDLTEARSVALLTPVDEPQAAALLELVQQTVGRRSAANDLLATRRGGNVILALRPVEEESPARVLTRLQRRAELAGIPTRASLSAGFLDLGAGLRQAEACLALIADSAPPALIDYQDLGPLRFLFGAPNIREMRALVVEELGPLVEHDRGERGARHLTTLRAYLDAGGHHGPTAKRCHIHVSTLKYRLARITDLLGCTLADPQVRFRLMLAFQIRDVLVRLGPDPLQPDAD